MGAAFKSPGRVAREEREKMLLLKHKVDNRITTARFGKESLDAGDYAGAVKRFNEYLTTIAEYKKVDDFYQLKVSHFDNKRDLTEMLLISHIFFEMARIYDAIPRFNGEFKKCLGLFVHFSVNQPYQVVNSELVRKYLKKSTFKNPDDFRNAYQQIFIQSKKCYIVTYCYESEHHITEDYRLFKSWLLKSDFGFELVNTYYRFSSSVINKWSDSPFLKISGKYFLKPMLMIFAKTLLQPIINQCKLSRD
jgi:hypothetical protein